ncbi:MBL fold metallo-hydrolase [Prauserella muralis]|uniref:MBL fold metallo-hydrolase n=1 Tax=Prauserella muralis TaxID=588067 RepID=A0A2V4AZU5_9PSEU|nr:MBL fold metallo-hydrolase [Prauserella muralis]PXY27464.1 MBL fold metallo-hydrolase [Prauserella muralis]TWE22826.1 glyoxylase-like metal-dependent hydrolase (beta-lactamase superfamily II) [Prauserella muralis]
MGEGRWIEVGDGVLVRRYAELDLSVGLVVGARRCLVVDTRGGAAQGAELAAAVRTVTPLPWSVALTHAHFDHSFGTAAFLPCDVWAHPGCRAALADDGPGDRRRWAQRYRAEGKPAIAADLEGTEIVLPGRLVGGHAELALGGRTVVLAHAGPAHTGHDLLVHVPDAGVTFAGDLVEHAPGGSFTTESFGPDSSLATWPAALDDLLALGGRVIVPGHGEPVDAAFVAAQREPLARLAQLRERVEEGGLTREEALARSPFPADVTEAALEPHR